MKELKVTDGRLVSVRLRLAPVEVGTPLPGVFQQESPGAVQAALLDGTEVGAFGQQHVRVVDQQPAGATVMVKRLLHRQALVERRTMIRERRRLEDAHARDRPRDSLRPFVVGRRDDQALGEESHVPRKRQAQVVVEADARDNAARCNHGTGFFLRSRIDEKESAIS
jgi:hypothetical protein